MKVLIAISTAYLIVTNMELLVTATVIMATIITIDQLFNR